MRFPAVLYRTDVMYVEHVDPRQAQPLQTVLERPHDRVVRVVEHSIERHRTLGCFAFGPVRLRAQQPSDFCRQHPLVARYRAQGVTDAALGLSKPVIGCGVDIAYPGRPSGAHDRLGLPTTDAHPGAAEGRAAETESGHFERGASERAFLETGHIA